MSSGLNEGAEDDFSGSSGYSPGQPARKYETTETAVVVMRHLRRLAASQGYVRQTEVVRVKLNERTGEIKVRRRKVNRRHKYLANQTHGYLAVNDGERAARDIGRLLGGGGFEQGDYGLVS